MAWIVRSISRGRDEAPSQGDLDAAIRSAVDAPIAVRPACSGIKQVNNYGAKNMQRRSFLKRAALVSTMAVAGLGAATHAVAADTIKVGVLHSLSGTMAISETVLK